MEVIYGSNSANEGIYSVYTRVDDVNWSPLTELEVNKNGKGNTHVEIDIPLDAEGSIKVQVLVKPVNTDGVVGYTNGFSEIPLKR